MATTVTVNRLIPSNTTWNFVDAKTGKVVATATNNTGQPVPTAITVPVGSWREVEVRTFAESGGGSRVFTNTVSQETDLEAPNASRAPTVTDANGGLWSLGVQQLADPNAAPTPTPSGAGGTIPAGTYKFATTWVTPSGGETLASPQTAGQVLSGSTSSVQIAPVAIPQGAYGWNVYATAAGGSILFKQNTNPLTGANTTLTTLNTTGANPPALSTAGLIVASKLA